MRSRLYIVLLALCTLLGVNSTDAVMAQNEKLPRFYADVTVHPQADDCFDSVYADFTRLLQRDLKQTGELNENSIRVAPIKNGQPGLPVPSRFIKDARYDALHNACGTLVFEVKSTPEVDTQTYRIFFDTQPGDYGALPKTNTNAPDAANMIWNGDFEILSQGYRGPNRYTNAGADLPQGWWGNLRNTNTLKNLSVEAHSGKNALAFVAPQKGKNTTITATPSPPALRVLPGQDYQFSFWVKGEGLAPDSVVVAASVYWYDKDQKPLPRVRVSALPNKLSEFPWTLSEVMLPAPPDAYYGAVRITTYSTTGYIAVDDVVARPMIPPLLKNAQFNR